MTSPECSILLIDRHVGWLKLAQEPLTQAGYKVVTAPDLDEATQSRLNEPFDLVFIGLDQAERNLDTLSEIAKSPDVQQRFVVMFPLRQTHEKMRIVFRAGAYDCVDKPYQSGDLLKIVAEKIADTERTNGFPVVIHNAGASGNKIDKKH